jgi:hypothetical protein
MNAFPLIFFISAIGSIAGTLLTRPEDDETLKNFYKNVRPWGFWKPVHEKVVRDDPSFRENKDFRRDMFNITVGIIWQCSLVVFPVFLVIREWIPFIISVGVMIISTLILRVTWWKKLKD